MIRRQRGTTIMAQAKIRAEHQSHKLYPGETDSAVQLLYQLDARLPALELNQLVLIELTPGEAPRARDTRRAWHAKSSDLSGWLRHMAGESVFGPTMWLRLDGMSLAMTPGTIVYAWGRDPRLVIGASGDTWAELNVYDDQLAEWNTASEQLWLRL